MCTKNDMVEVRGVCSNSSLWSYILVSLDELLEGFASQPTERRAISNKVADQHVAYENTKSSIGNLKSAFFNPTIHIRLRIKSNKKIL